MTNNFNLSTPIDKTTGKFTDILTWGKNNLSESDYNRLVAAQARQDALVNAAGGIFESFTETVWSSALQSNIEVQIGTKISWPSGPPQNDPEWDAFHVQFSNDPNIKQSETI